MRAWFRVIRQKGSWAFQISLPGILVFAFFIGDPSDLLVNPPECEHGIWEDAFDKDLDCQKAWWNSFREYLDTGKPPMPEGRDVFYPDGSYERVHDD